MAGPWDNYAKPAETTAKPWETYAQPQGVPLQPMQQEQTEPQRDIISTTSDGGVFYREHNGSLGFTSPSYSTTDQATIAKMLEGQKPADIGQAQIDEQRIATAPITARALKAQEGVPFIGSYTDEIVGALDPAKGESLRQLSGSMERQHPNESMALGLGGAVAGSVPAALVAGPAFIGNAARTVGARALQAAGLGGIIGGIEGAISGYGRSEGDGRASNAISGGMFGGGAGAVLGAAAPYAAEGIKKVLTNMRGTDVSVISKQLGVSAPAARVIKSALDAGDMKEAAQALARAGDTAMLADAGQPAQQLLDAAANTGGAAGRIATKAVDERVTGASKDLVNTLDQTLGKPVGRASLARGVREGTASARDQAYNLAYSKPIDYSKPRGRMLEGLFNRIPQSAINEANALMRANGEESAQIIAKIGPNGKVKFETMPDVRQLDYITRGLKSVADKEDGKGKLGGTTALGNAYNRLSGNIRDVLKGEVPEYKEALDIASDAISRVKAGETGYALLRDATTRETVADALRGASKSERDAMKQGVRSYIDDVTANVSRAITDSNMDAREALKVLKDVSKRSNQQKLRYLLGKDASEKMMMEIDRAVVPFELRAALAANSKTAIRGSIQGSVEQQAGPGMLETLSDGEPINAAKRFVQVFTGNSDEAKALRKAGIYEEIATALTQTRGNNARAALALVDKAMSGTKLNASQAAYIGKITAESLALSGSHEASKQLSTR